MSVLPRRRSSILVAVVLAALAASAAWAAGRWVVLGTRDVTDRLDHDTIVVTGARGSFDAVQIRVRRVAVQFHSVVIHFGDGADQKVDLRDVIRAGGASRVIDIDGHDRVIRSVELWYDSQSLHGKSAVVRLFGRH